MKSLLKIFILTIVCLLISCDDNVQMLADQPEEVLKLIEVENEERTMTIYGAHHVNDELALIVFKGVMNDQDVWLADVHKVSDQWKVIELVQLSGPFAGEGDRQTVVINDELGYEVGYMTNDVLASDRLKIIEVTHQDWKVWIKSS